MKFEEIKNKLDLNVKFTLSERLKIKNGRYKGVKLTVEGDVNSISNPEVYMGNLDRIKIDLIKKFYNVEQLDIEELTDAEFYELYRPIEEADPLGLKQKQK